MSIKAEAGDRNLIVVTEENFTAAIEQVIETLSTGDGVECDCQALTDVRQDEFHQACSARIKTLANGKNIHTLVVGSEAELEEVSRQIMAAGGPNLSDILRRRHGLGQSGGAINLDQPAAPALDELAMARQRKQMSLEVRAYLLADCNFNQIPFSTVLTTDNYAEMIDRAITALTGRRPVLIGLGLLPQALRDEVDEDMHAAARQADAGLLTNRFMATNDGKIIIDDQIVEPGDISNALHRSLMRNFGAAAAGGETGLNPSLKSVAEATAKLAALRAEAQPPQADQQEHVETMDEFYANNREARLDAAEASIAKQVTTDLAMKAAMGAAAFLTLLEHDPEAARDRTQIEAMFADIIEASVQSVANIQDDHELEFPATAVLEYGHARDLDKLDDDQLDNLMSAQDEVLKVFTQGTDATLWASAFLITLERSQESIILDTSFLMAWFANAIEAGRTAGIQQTRQREVQQAYEDGIQRGLFLAKVQVVAETGDGGTKASPLNTSPTGDAPLAGGKAPEGEPVAQPEPVAAG